MSQVAIIGIIGLMALCCSSSSTMLMMGGGDDSSSGSSSTDPTTPAASTDPCAGLTDDSLASSVSIECLRKILTDEGCTDQGTAWPADDYDGWWRQSPQGTTTVYCDNEGTPCGAGNYATVKRDIHAWATLTDPWRVAGCGRAT
jgi:hypothetical protein